uniref:Uncharacterized protein LOC108038497 n=1 Tax=Drosophila rhopaloa TaxID=1041015 RepID=A0A6P4E6D9_DRORH
MGPETTDRQLCNLCFPHLINAFSQDEHSTEDARNVAKGCDEDITQERHGHEEPRAMRNADRKCGAGHTLNQTYMAQERAKMFALPA